MNIVTSDNLIVDINNLFWMAVYGDIQLVKIQLQISRISLLTRENWIVRIKN